ncbi:unnamed protein product [Spirodela intermedia]|uniref:DUF4057 domain-containing protein n=1 Tax=Spirodela intermedia TaxID=51605 RepID=A0A7I8INF4_SPIIN|nr:unnamed protein product [Spirodela intermedia]CAA6659507.1 unnamed protein product [Spirodela intermedia]
MEKSKPVRKSYTSTADLLTWTENAPMESPAAEPSAGISAVLFGGQMTEEEAESLMKTKPCSSSKLKEMTGSGIFAGDQDNGASEAGCHFSTPNNRTGLRLYQPDLIQRRGERFSKKPTTLPEMAKQRELSGTLETESERDARMKKQLSEAKNRELSGHGIFTPRRRLCPGRHRVCITRRQRIRCECGRYHFRLILSGGLSSIILGEEPVLKTAKKIYDQKFAELSGNNPLSVAKLREMTGSDIFADDKVSSREYYGGVRKPPGGESTIALV